MAEPIRVGLVGPRGNWGSRAHIPSLKALPEYELKAVCTTSEATAREASAAFGVPLAFHDYHAMSAHPEVDLVVVSVRVPYHHEIVMAALEAGKNVLCEWPLGANLREAEGMTATARAKGVRAIAGLQARSDPAIMRLRELIAEGWIGDVLTASLTVFNSGILERPADRTWAADAKAGANTLTIHGGHNIDALCYCLGEFAEVSATVATQVGSWRVTGSNDSVAVTAPDNVLVNGRLQSGAVVSIHAGTVPFSGSSARLEVYGSRGTIALLGGMTLNLGPNRLVGARNGEAMEELPIPDRLVFVPEGTPSGMTYNLSQAYVRLAQSWHGGTQDLPDFDAALTRHRLLAALQRSSDEGRRVRLTEVA